MKFSEGSILRQYERAFRAYGIEISFEDEALRLIADAAAKEKTGARGLLTVFEKLFRDYKYHLAGSGLTQLRVSEELVREPKRVLERLMAEGPQAGRGGAEAECACVRRSISSANTASRLQFRRIRLATPGRARRAERMTMQELCAHLFKDFQFGLSLIEKNTRKHKVRPRSRPRSMRRINS